MNKNQLYELLLCPQCNRKNLNFDKELEQLYCPNCQTVYPIKNKIPVMLPPTPLDIKIIIKGVEYKAFNYIDHYEKDACNFDYLEERIGETGHSERRTREYITSIIPDSAKRILDVGCGNAWVANHFTSKAIEVISMDLSLKNTTNALKIVDNDYHYAIVADSLQLPFKPGSFDLIIASEVIEHVINPKIFINNLLMSLSDGGLLIVTTPYKEKINYGLCIHCNKPTPGSAHLHSFDEKKLEALANKELVHSFRYITFNNKILQYLRTYKILKYLGFKLWRIVDRLFNLIKTPARIICIWKKQITGN